MIMPKNIRTQFYWSFFIKYEDAEAVSHELQLSTK